MHHPCVVLFLNDTLHISKDLSIWENSVCNVNSENSTNGSSHLLGSPLSPQGLAMFLMHQRQWMCFCDGLTDFCY